MPIVAIATARRVRGAEMPSGVVGRVLNGAIDILVSQPIAPPPCRRTLARALSFD